VKSVVSFPDIRIRKFELFISEPLSTFQCKYVLHLTFQTLCYPP